MLILSDFPGTSGGEYITVVTGNESTNEPPAEGVATYVFTVAGGTYKVLCRVVTYNLDIGDDSCWFRIQGAATRRPTTAAAGYDGMILNWDKTGIGMWSIAVRTAI